MNSHGYWQEKQVVTTKQQKTIKINGVTVDQSNTQDSWVNHRSGRAMAGGFSGSGTKYVDKSGTTAGHTYITAATGGSAGYSSSGTSSATTSATTSASSYQQANVQTNQVKQFVAKSDFDKTRMLFSANNIHVDMAKLYVGDKKTTGSAGAIHDVTDEEIRANQTMIRTRNKYVGKGEVRSYTAHINSVLAEDDLCTKLGHNKIKVPSAEATTGQFELYDRVQDGIIFCKLVNACVPGTISEQSINTTKLDQVFRRNENLTLGVNSAESIGCICVGTTTVTIRDKHVNIILGLLWQLIAKHSFKKIDLRENPNLRVLLREGETLEDFMSLSAEEILLRWVNYHLQRSDHWDKSKTVTNFTRDIQDSKAYICLMNQIQPKKGEANFVNLSHEALNYSSMQSRAEAAYQMANKLKVGDYITPEDILEMQERVNTLFVAQLFNNYLALEPVNVVEEIIQETREEKTYRNWINSMPLGIQQIIYLYPALQGGVVLLKLEDAINPGCVNWDIVWPTDTYKKYGGLHKKIENCDLAIKVGKENLKITIIGINGANISDGHKMFILAIVWQLMRCYTLKVIKSAVGNPSNEKEADKIIINWCNQRITNTSHTFKSFSDSSLSNSQAILDVVESLQPGTVNKSHLSQNSQLENARYALSCCRKIGARVYALPEHIVECDRKMVMTVFAQLMGLGMMSGVASSGDQNIATHRQF